MCACSFFFSPSTSNSFLTSQKRRKEEKKEKNPFSDIVNNERVKHNKLTSHHWHCQYCSLKKIRVFFSLKIFSLHFALNLYITLIFFFDLKTANYLDCVCSSIRKEGPFSSLKADCKKQRKMNFFSFLSFFSRGF